MEAAKVVNHQWLMFYPCVYMFAMYEPLWQKEGWASYWHQRILRELDLTSGEAIEFAKLNAGVVQPSKTGINPYYLGIKIFRILKNVRITLMKK